MMCGRNLSKAILFWVIASTLLSVVIASRALAEDCPKWLQDTVYCKNFIVYKPPGSPVDKRIDAYIKSDDNDLSVRSFAFFVSVSEYPNFAVPEERTLKSVKADFPNIVKFLQDQKFDEIIVLQDQDATKEKINFFLEQYLLSQVRDYHRRSRFLFMYDGHGLQGSSADIAGALALSAISGDSDGDPSHSYSLDDLQSRLRKISAEAYHSLALIGSCYSGGIFPIVSNKGENFSYPRDPGSHAVTAARADELARGAPDGKGTVFFEELLSAINKSAVSSNSAQLISGADGGSQKVLGTTIVRLGQVVEAMDMALEDLEIPGTNPVQYGPQLRIGSLISDETFNGAFFFLAPLEAEKQASTKGSELPPQEMDIRTTGSAVLGEPAVKVFSPPDDYRIRGVDFNSYDGSPAIDVVGSGQMVKFLYQRASIGSDKRDINFSQYRAAASRAGLSFGAVHIFDCSPINDQVKNLLSAAPPDVALLPVAIDLEWYKPNGSPILQACASDQDMIRTNLLNLIGLIQQAYGKQPIVYASRQGISDILKSDFNKYALWYAERSDAGSPGYPGDNPWSIWQVTKTASIDGFDKPVNYNVFFGSRAQFDLFTTTGENTARQAAMQK